MFALLTDDFVLRFSSGLRRVFVYTIFLSVVFIAFYFFFWRGSLDKLSKERDSIGTIEKALVQTQKYIADWPVTAESELQQAEKDLEEFLAKIPEKEDIPEILRKIQEYGIKNARLNVTSIENINKEKEEPEESITTKKQAEKEEKETKYAKGTYKIAASGNYFDVITFLRNFETMERLINVEVFNLDNFGDADNINLDLTFSIFYSKPEEESALD